MISPRNAIKASVVVTLIGTAITGIFLIGVAASRHPATASWFGPPPAKRAPMNLLAPPPRRTVELPTLVDGEGFSEVASAINHQTDTMLRAHYQSINEAKIAASDAAWQRQMDQFREESSELTRERNRERFGD